MKNLNKLALICAVSASAVFANAPSTKGNFTGFYAGGGLGIVKKKAQANDFDIKSSKTGASFSVFGGYGHQMNNLYLGAELAVKLDTGKPTKSNDTFATQLTATSFYYGKAKVSSKESMIIGFAPRIGYVFDSLLVYLKPGFEYSKFSETVDFDGAISNSAANAKAAFEGSTAAALATGSFKSKKSAKFAFRPAIGAEYKLNKNLTTRMEYSCKQVSRTVNVDGQTTMKSSGASTARALSAGKVKKVNHNLTLGVAYIF